MGREVLLVLVLAGGTVAAFSVLLEAVAHLLEGANATADVGLRAFIQGLASPCSYTSISLEPTPICRVFLRRVKTFSCLEFRV